jgi:hypothetical protein
MTEITERKELNLWLSVEPLGWRRVTVCIGNYVVAIILGLNNAELEPGVVYIRLVCAHRAAGGVLEVSKAPRQMAFCTP